MTDPERFSLSKAWSLVLAALVVALTLWARAAADPDFPLANPFSGLTVWAVAVFVLSGFVRHRVVRANLRVVLAVVPIAILLVMEVRMATAPTGDPSIEISDDVLLRYHYRPGATRHTPTGPEPETINSRGLWDDEYAIPKPEGVYRIVVLGDSVPNDPRILRASRFHRVMLRELNARSVRAERVEVINVSCEGYNTFQEVRLLEAVGLDYEPDLVVVAYVLNDAFAQNGGYRRFGNSYVAFRAVQMLALLRDGSFCPAMAELNSGYSFELVVRASLERLRLLGELRHFETLVAALPIVEDFADADCLATYDRIGAIAAEQGFAFARLIDAFEGEDYEAYLQPEDRYDVTHPNAAGHERLGVALADHVEALLPAAR